MPETLTNEIAELRETILAIGFDRYEGTFAGDQEANNKLNLERLAFHPLLSSRVAAHVAELIEFDEPDLLVSTPRGADWLAHRVGDLMDVPVLELYKDEETKGVSYFLGGLETVRQSERLVIIEDVLNRRTNTNKVYHLPELGGHAVAAVGIWDRNPAAMANLALPTKAFITEAIPDILPEDDPLWRYAK